MGIETALIIGAVAAVAGTTMAVVNGNRARADARAAQASQEKAANEQRAQNAQDKAQAARDQYREDRVRRARIMQSAANTGTQDSAGELGALGSLNTIYSNNQGNQSGAYDRGVAIGGFQQQASNSIFQSQQDQSRAAQAGQFAALGQSIFSLGLGNMKTAAKVPGTTTQQG